jgi:hypothetical protein
MNPDQPAELARRIIENNQYLVLASADATCQPGSGAIARPRSRSARSHAAAMARARPGTRHRGTH